jgi:hypothetical protein
MADGKLTIGFYTVPPRYDLDRESGWGWRPGPFSFLTVFAMSCLLGWCLSDGGLAGTIAACSGCAVLLLSLWICLQAVRIRQLEAYVAKLLRRLDRLEMPVRPSPQTLQFIEIVTPGSGFGPEPGRRATHVRTLQPTEQRIDRLLERVERLEGSRRLLQ